MGLKDAWKALFNAPQSEIPRIKEGPIVAYANVGTRVAPKDRYDQLAQDGYIQNAVVYRCVNEIAQGAASVKWQLMRGDQPVEDNPILSLLNRPNPSSNGSEFFQEVYSYLLLSGNSFIMRSGPDQGNPREMYTLRPDRVQVVPGKREIPDRYDYIVNGHTAASYPIDQSTGESDVKQIKLFNPLNDFYGLSPVMPAAVDIDQHNMSNKHNVALLMNGARPSGAVVYRPRDESGSMTMLTEAQRDQLRSDLSQRFEKAENAGRTMILEGDFDYKEMGMTPKDMDFSAMKNMSARDIALCFGVPGQLVGIPDSQTYANMAEARLALYEETIIPMLRHIESDMNEWLIPAFGDETLTLSYNIDDIPAISERRRMIYDNVIRAVETGIITRNEARERLTLEPLSGGDDVYIPANLFPLGSPEPNPPQPADQEEADKLYQDVYGEKLDNYADGEEVPENLPDSYQLATTKEKCQNCKFHAHQMGSEKGYGSMYCTKWESAVRPDYYCVSWAALPEGLSALLYKKVDTKPTSGMAEAAERALNWREEYNRGGTRVGVARANQLVRRENLSEDVVLRMFSFFSRHEVDKRAEGFRQGEDGFPTAGRIAWDLWGGDEGFTWSRRKRDQIMKEREKAVHAGPATKANGSEAIASTGVS